MKYWTIYYPGELGQHIAETFSEDQILISYWPYWEERMRWVGLDKLISRDNCIEDWKIIHYAVETDQFGNRIGGPSD